MRRLDSGLLRILRQAPVHLPPSELAAQVGTTRAGVAAEIERLREAGFDIDERPGLGYRLVTTPDRLIGGDLFSRLGNCALVREILVFEETDSTNERALKFGRDGTASGLAIFAERQRTGRGRFGRRWESAAHLGLWFSVLLRPAFGPEKWPRLTTWAAVSIAAALKATLGVEAGIKWPNDIQLGGLKVAGILIETAVDAAQENFAVIGLGLNVNHALADFPTELAGKATSLRLITGRQVDRPALAAAILRELDARYADADRRFDQLLAEARRRSVLLGRWIQVRAGETTHEGIAEALDDAGQLVLRAGNSELRTLSAGEVTVAGDGSPIA
jgi:BirA family biotin operon repressor/biotin-[acetyl-CoA-carboxylase] ligase